MSQVTEYQHSTPSCRCHWTPSHKFISTGLLFAHSFLFYSRRLDPFAPVTAGMPQSLTSLTGSLSMRALFRLALPNASSSSSGSITSFPSKSNNTSLVTLLLLLVLPTVDARLKIDPTFYAVRIATALLLGMLSLTPSSPCSIAGIWIPPSNASSSTSLLPSPVRLPFPLTLSTTSIPCYWNYS